MTATRGDIEGTTPRRRSGARDAVACWAIVVAFVLLWQLVAYRGLIALAAEWQFDTFGRYYPALTYVLLVVVLGSPILWLMRLRDAPAADGDAANPARAEPLAGAGVVRALLALAIGCATASMAAALAMLAQPDGEGAAARVAIGSAAAAAPAAGATVLVGDIVADRVAGLSEDVFIARRSFRFVPMIAPGGREEPIRYFAEIGAGNTLVAARRDGALTGILAHDALPGELVRLFRYAGFEIAADYHVLFATRESLQWPYRVLAVELALVALLCGGGALALHGRRERQGRIAAGGKTLPPN